MSCLSTSKYFKLKTFPTQIERPGDTATATAAAGDQNQGDEGATAGGSASQTMQEIPLASLKETVKNQDPSRSSKPAKKAKRRLKSDQQLGTREITQYMLRKYGPEASKSLVACSRPHPLPPKQGQDKEGKFGGKIQRY